MTIVIRLLATTVPGTSSVSDALRIALCTIVGVFVFFVVYRSLGGRELGVLLRGRLRKTKK
jgi:hypothetical protein